MGGHAHDGGNRNSYESLRNSYAFGRGDANPPCERLVPKQIHKGHNEHLLARNVNALAAGADGDTGPPRGCARENGLRLGVGVFWNAAPKHNDIVVGALATSRIRCHSKLENDVAVVVEIRPPALLREMTDFKEFASRAPRQMLKPRAPEIPTTSSSKCHPKGRGHELAQNTNSFHKARKKSNSADKVSFWL